MACDDEVPPSQERIEAVVDDSHLQDAYDTERHLLYVAWMRARDHLMVSGVKPASEFLMDLEPSNQPLRVAREDCTQFSTAARIDSIPSLVSWQTCRAGIRLDPQQPMERSDRGRCVQ